MERLWRSGLGRHPVHLHRVSKYGATRSGIVAAMNGTTGSHERRCAAHRLGRSRPAGLGATRATPRHAPVDPAAPASRTRRLLTTMVFADVVGSTALVEALGDARWREVLGRFYGVARHHLARAGGAEVVPTGDGLLATFGAPAAAVRYGQDLQRAVTGVGLPVRVGVHTAEVEFLGDDIAGLGVHIAARVAGLGSPGEVWVTRTVRDVVAGSGLRFEARGRHTLKGVTEPWELHAAVV
jgi:class 3 adenylate cyclase